MCKNIIIEDYLHTRRDMKPNGERMWSSFMTLFIVYVEKI